jgi:hypothetical protein
MDAKSELQKTQEMLKSAGFQVVDVQFEGAIVAQDAKVQRVINAMAEAQQAFGVLRVYYDIGGEVRVIEIPVGNMPEGAPEEKPKK